MIRVLVTLLTALPVATRAQDTCAVRVADVEAFHMMGLTGRGPGYVEQPQALWAGGALILLGPVMVQDLPRPRMGDTIVGGLYTGLRRDTAGVLHVLPSLTALPDTMTLHWPRAVAEGETVHVVWARALPEPRRSVAHTLYYARLERGRWSTPEVIASGRRFGWTTIDQTALVRLGDTLLIAVPEEADSGRSRIVLFRRARGRWSESHIPASSFTHYLSLAAVPGMQAIGYVQAIGDSADWNTGGGVFSIQSPNGGLTWSAPVRIHRLGSQSAFETQALALADSSIAVIWAQSESGGLISDSLMVATLKDGSWARHPSLAVPGGFRFIRAVAGPGNGFWAATEIAGHDGLFAARWAAGHWCPVPIATPPGGFTVPSPALSPDGTLHLFWGQWKDEPGYTAFTRTATVAGCCPASGPR